MIEIKGKNMINVEVRKNPKETGLNLLRRFSRKVKEAGFMVSLKARRRRQKPKSKLQAKKSALRMIAKRKMIEKLKKLGRI